MDSQVRESGGRPAAAPSEGGTVDCGQPIGSPICRDGNKNSQRRWRRVALPWGERTSVMAAQMTSTRGRKCLPMFQPERRWSNSSKFAMGTSLTAPWNSCFAESATRRQMGINGTASTGRMRRSGKKPSMGRSKECARSTRRNFKNDRVREIFEHWTGEERATVEGYSNYYWLRGEGTYVAGAISCPYCRAPIQGLLRPGKPFAARSGGWQGSWRGGMVQAPAFLTRLTRLSGWMPRPALDSWRDIPCGARCRPPSCGVVMIDRRPPEQSACGLYLEWWGRARRTCGHHIGGIPSWMTLSAAPLVPPAWA
jgi:hypothetical protein